MDNHTTILNAVEYCTLATIAEDGAPQNVPVRFAFDDEYLYFRSPAITQHGVNIERSPKVAVVVVDTTQQTKGAVYIRSVGEFLHGEDEAKAIAIFNKRFNNPANQWSETKYYRIKIGVINPDKTIGNMYYFQEQSK